MCVYIHIHIHTHKKNVELWWSESEPLNLCMTDPSLESDPDLGHVGNEANGSAQHLVLHTLNGVSLYADHLPADLLERQDLDKVGTVVQ